MDFEQQQEITKILEQYRNNPSNSNKYRFELFAYIDKALEQAEQTPQGQFITYTGEAISLCSNCPQFKRENGWDITQCNHCATRLDQLTESKSNDRRAE